MAKKRVHHRRKRRVSAPKRHTKRRRRMGAPLYASSVGKSRRRRRRVGAPRRKRRRMGAARTGGGGTLMEFITTTLGVGVGLGLGEIGGRFAGATIPEAALSVIKVVGGGATFAVGKNMMNNNGLVKGIGIGLAGSGINSGIRVMLNNIPGIPASVHGPNDRDMYVVLPDMGAEKSVIGWNRQLYPANKMGATKSVIGMQNSRLYGDAHSMMNL